MNNGTPNPLRNRPKVAAKLGFHVYAYVIGAVAPCIANMRPLQNLANPMLPETTL